MMLSQLLRRLASTKRSLVRALGQPFAAVMKPAAPSLVMGTLADLTRCRPALIAENVLLRQQLLILRRSVKRPRCTLADRARLVLLANRVRDWRQALLIVQPETVLRWHRQPFRRCWRR